MTKLPKKFTKQLKDLVNIAYEREADIRLQEFSKSVDEWRKGLLGGVELISLIHEFDRGQSKAFTGMYDRLDPPLLVSRALVEGFIKNDEVPKELLGILKNVIEFYKKNKPQAREEIPEDLL
jgi:hypothetical protein